MSLKKVLNIDLPSAPTSSKCSLHVSRLNFQTHLSSLSCVLRAPSYSAWFRHPNDMKRDIYGNKCHKTWRDAMWCFSAVTFDSSLWQFVTGWCLRWLLVEFLPNIQDGGSPVSDCPLLLIYQTYVLLKASRLCFISNLVGQLTLNSLKFQRETVKIERCQQNLTSVASGVQGRQLLL